MSRFKWNDRWLLEMFVLFLVDNYRAWIWRQLTGRAHVTCRRDRSYASSQVCEAPQYPWLHYPAVQV